MFGVVLYVEVPIFAFYLTSRPVATILIGAIALEFGLLLIVQPGYRYPIVTWSFVVGTLAAVGAIFGGLLARALDEAARLGELRRFLSPQVAEALLDARAEHLFVPHRREIAVMFCDLRGFTAFSTGAEPEEVVNVLRDYYAAVGSSLQQASATVGTFAGDGIMAYFNDPVPCDDPAGTVVTVAQSVRVSLDHLETSWRARGFELGYGIGIAYGYATLGTIGFEGRVDYTALGPVVNLASRLCSEAQPGEILIDQRLFAALAPTVGIEERRASLKGFGDTVKVFSLSATPASARIPPED